MARERGGGIILVWSLPSVSAQPPDHSSTGRTANWPSPRLPFLQLHRRWTHLIYNTLLWDLRNSEPFSQEPSLLHSHPGPSSGQTMCRDRAIPAQTQDLSPCGATQGGRQGRSAGHTEYKQPALHTRPRSVAKAGSALRAAHRAWGPPVCTWVNGRPSLSVPRANQRGRTLVELQV